MSGIWVFAQISKSFKTLLKFQQSYESYELVEDYEHLFKLPKYLKHLLKLGYYHWPTTLLPTTSGFLYLFSPKNSQWFLTKMLVPISYLRFGRNHNNRVSYDLYNQSSRSFKIFGNRIFISKWDKKLFQSGADSTTFYFKVGQVLFQSGAETVISKWVIVYVKVG